MAIRNGDKMNFNLKSSDKFSGRHIGPNEEELSDMLNTIGLDSLDELIDETVPPDIRLKTELNLPEAIGEYKFLKEVRKIANKNQVFRSFIGLGYYDCIVPSVIQRNILENPGWYTQYTPYQSEISQGRLEALLNFQTMVSELTQMDVASASLLDEATAAAEAMTLCFRVRNKDLIKRSANTFFVSNKCFPQTIELLKTRSEPLGIQLISGEQKDYQPNENVFGGIVQYPDSEGNIVEIGGFIQKIQSTGALSVIATDLLSLTLLVPPGELEADVVVGSSQRFGVPLGYGGPHAAFFATKEDFKRQIPGRIIGVSIDSNGKKAYRMALQTREQHIRREKATSNICTAQALLAIMSGMYAVYHGPKGLKSIAKRIYGFSKILEGEILKLGYEQQNSIFFDTLKIKVTSQQMKIIRTEALSANMNFRYIDEQNIGISLDETIETEDIKKIVSIFSKAAGKPAVDIKLENVSQEIDTSFPQSLERKSGFLIHSVFNSFHSETKMMRYIRQLENRDLSLTVSMIPLGSCTMKLNAATEMIPISWPEFSNLHPFCPTEQAQGYLQVFQELEKMLCEITGFHTISFQPNSGAQGEYASLLVIRAYLRDKGEPQRDVVLIPSSAHGTNPASAVMAGMKVVIVSCDRNGNIDLTDLKANATEHRNTLAAIMITYPSTHGVFEENIREVCSIIHENGGQVFMDGANMNAQVGLTNPALIGADVGHLNLHKTFSIPHGGGGPGMGPIGVAKHLAPYLPSHPIIKTGGEKGISSVSASPWGNASILLISYAYLRLLGAKGATLASKYAILNANYIKSRLENQYDVLYKGKCGRVAHEMIFDFRSFKQQAGIEVEDVAKRLMDYGFHAPTVAWPVIGTMMVEPTESEGKDELDRFCDALLEIKKEIHEIADGIYPREDNVLKNSPHTIESAVSDNWNHSYSREKALFPLPYLREYKFWPASARIDNVYGDRNLVCTCPSIEVYQNEDSAS
jgi:glycine dehydrogenase